MYLTVQYIFYNTFVVLIITLTKTCMYIVHVHISFEIMNKYLIRRHKATIDLLQHFPTITNTTFKVFIRNWQTKEQWTIIDL